LLAFGIATGFAWLALSLASPPPAASRPLQTAIVADGVFYGRDADLAFSRSRAAGATAIRLQLSWREIAPTTRPAGFDPTNPADPAYRWGLFDRLVQNAYAYGLTPFIGIGETPAWAERAAGGRPGANRPDPVELGRFAEAAARRYSGSFNGLPRVQTWEVWNEANASFFLYPQKQGGRAVSPGIYRGMVNAFAAGVHRVRADNRVIAGGLLPFVLNRAAAQAVGPLKFMRKLLCISKRLRPARHCKARVHFDIWSHHPYTSGGPTHAAAARDSVSINELPRMRALLRAGVRFHHVVHSARHVRFWVTEFSWDTSPPDRLGVPQRLHARWVAEALYRMWRAGVSLVTWFQLRDDAAKGRPDSSTFQSGLYNRCDGGIACDTPKPALRAFTFPFVAFRSGNRARVWGRLPPSTRGRVIVEQRVHRRWKRIGRLRSDGNGIFTRRLRLSGRGPLRARPERPGPTALPFSLVRPPDRPVNPFG
jgi:hypothetical protein